MTDGRQLEAAKACSGETTEETKLAPDAKPTETPTETPPHLPEITKAEKLARKQAKIAIITKRLAEPSDYIRMRMKQICELQVLGAVRRRGIRDKRNGEIVWVEQGETVPDLLLAAQFSRLTLKYARQLPKSAVYQAIYAETCQQLRTSQTANNLHVAIKVRDKALQDDATAAQQTVSLKAAEYLDGKDGKDEAGNVTINITPGYVMDLSGPAVEPRKVIDVTPVKTQTEADDEA